MKYLQFDAAIFKTLVRLAIPMIISQGAFALMIFCDRYFLSMLSPAHMSAGMGGGTLAHATFSLFIGVLAYSNALVAQYYGAGEYGRCSRVVTQGLLLSLLALPVIAVAALVFAQLFQWMGHSASQVRLEQSYYYLLILGAPLVFAKTCIGSFFAGTGKSSVVMVADVTSVLINIPLTYALIFGHWGAPSLGIEGAAISTVISSLLGLLIFCGYYFSVGNRRLFVLGSAWVWDKAIATRLFRFGTPGGLEQFLNMAAFQLFLLLFQSYGVVEGASASIVFNWDILSFIPMLGLGIAMTSLTGRYIGAGDLLKLNHVIRAGFVIGLSASAMMAFLCLSVGDKMVEVFITNASVVEAEGIRGLGGAMMMGLACYVMADAIALVCGGVLRGAGDTRWLALTSISMHWMMLLLVVVAAKVMTWPALWIWWIFVGFLVLRAMAYLLRLMGGRWRSRERIQRVLGR